MSAMHLIRIDEARNMHRFYRLDVQPDPFGGVAVVKEWGRIGAGGRVCSESYSTRGTADLALARLMGRKIRRG